MLNRDMEVSLPNFIEKTVHVLTWFLVHLVDFYEFLRLVVFDELGRHKF